MQLFGGYTPLTITHTLVVIRGKVRYYWTILFSISTTSDVTCGLDLRRHTQHPTHDEDSISACKLNNRRLLCDIVTVVSTSRGLVISRTH